MTTTPTLVVGTLRVSGGTIDSIVNTVPTSIESGSVSVANADATDKIYAADGSALTPKHAVINASSSGDNTIVAAVAAKKILVLAYTLVASGIVTVTWKSDIGGGATALSGPMSLLANGILSVAYAKPGLFAPTGTNVALNLYLSGAIAVAGHLLYVETA